MTKEEEQTDKGRHVAAVFPSELLARLDAWRAQQSGGVSRAQALRLIVGERLAAVPKRARGVRA